MRREYLPAWIVLCISLCFFSEAVTASENEAGFEFFEKHVRPILVNRCFECHSSSQKIKGGLALDSKNDWLTGGDSGSPIVPGSPQESLLIEAVSWKNISFQMPPKTKLAASELRVLEEWIEMGAPDPRDGAENSPSKKKPSTEEKVSYWSYQPIQHQFPPVVQNTDWCRNAIDQFVLAKLEEKGLQPSMDAASEDLARRISFAIVGLPPTIQQLREFCDNDRIDRERAVAIFTEKLIGTHRFGEKWGRHWLDVVRFAESSGGGRTLLFKDAWRFRDYVIDSFNNDVPIDQLILEHVAGDLLPTHSREQRCRNLVAAGFLSFGPTIYEEQDKQRLRYDVIDEQIDTIGKAFLGQTVGCARCHDHKFDPISQKDYYAIAGIFASTRTLSNYTDNVVSWYDAKLPLPDDQDEIVTRQEKQLKELTSGVAKKKNEIAKLKDKVSGIAFKQNQPIPLSEVPGVTIDDSAAVANGTWKQSKYSPLYFGDGYVHDDNKEKGAMTLTFTPKLPVSGRYEVRLAYPSADGRATKVPVHVFHAMGDSTVYVNQKKPPDIEGRFVSLGSYSFEKDGDSYVIISNEGTSGYVCADLIQFVLEGSEKTVAPDPKNASELTKLQTELVDLESQLKELKANSFVRPLAMSVREEDKIGDTEIRIRGDVHQKGAIVPRGFLTIIPTDNLGIPKDQSGRIELAQWIASPKNPLTARVLVNRVWAWMFGTGLVRTVDNLGTTGESPSHPELLDYLAIQFMENQWSMKWLVNEIATSRTWQLSCHPNAADAENRWLAAANRRRLDAEQIRDAIMYISDDLDNQFGGPNIVGAKASASDSGEASNIEFGYKFTDSRRSVYTPAFRNNRLEIFETFDFGDTNTSQGLRPVSTVALQSLYFLNSPFVIKQAQKSAAKYVDSSDSKEQILKSIFEECVARPPSNEELQACLQLMSFDKDSIDKESKIESLSIIYQSIFGSIDFRYLK